MDAPTFSSVVQYFFTQHLRENKHVGPRTIEAYRDTFKLFLTYLQARTGRSAATFTLADLDAPAVLGFLDHLERQRGNTAQSRNARLCAIRSFLHIAAVRDPAHMGVIERVLAIPNKRTVKPLITYLTQEEMNAVLAAPDRSTWIGCRDHALLLTLYNTGARASEITGLVVNQIVFGSSTQVLLHGKGRKERTVPLWSQTGRVLRRWLQTTEANESSVVFPSNRGAALSRDGLDLLLQKAVESAAGCCPNLLKKNITPHVIRHTTAMHLLQAGVDIAVIALWLGHESIETTHAYIEADLTMKQRALAKLTPAQTRTGRFRANDELLDFLSRL